MKKIICLVLTFILLFSMVNVFSKNVNELESDSVILMDQTTGKILYEKNADKKREIASVTKVMTALILMEEIDAGNIKYTDMITVSANAEAMGGSQIYLKAGEQMSVHDMLKGLILNSGNDAAVAIAEHVSGTEEAFVARMNQRAKELGMNDTLFQNPNGLPHDNQYSTAKDVAIMSRELMNNHPKIKEYTTIWTDYIRGGTLLLSNTNKLLSPAVNTGYPGATGLKTGYTDNALNCLSATAERDGMGLVAVVLGASTSDLRFNEAKILFDYGFDNYSFKEVIEKDEFLGTVSVVEGKNNVVNAVVKEDLVIFDNKQIKGEYTYELDIVDSVKAPVEKGVKVGVYRVKKGDTIMGEVDVVISENVKKRSFFQIIKLYFESWMGVR